MRDFSIIQNLIGESVTAEQLQNVDCYVQKKLGLFIPSLGICGYAARENHTHPSYMVIIYFSDTSAKPNQYPAEIFSPKIPHNDSEECHYYCILVEKVFFESQWQLYTTEPPHFTPKQFFICSDILKTLNTFAFEYSKQMPHSEITLDAQVTMITHWIVRSLLGETMDMRAISSDFSVARAQHYMERHFAEKITAAELAKLSYISVSSLNRKFKSEIGITPMQYLLELRITRAKTLLRRKNIPVTEVAMRCGFGSSSHFCTVFLRQTGMTPSAYQEKYLD